MKIIFTLSKNMNHFFFVQNLAEWHFSCRKRYNEVWLEQTEPLSGEEIKVLDSLKLMLQKYGFKKLDSDEGYNIFDYFLRYDERNHQESVVTKREFDIYKTAMNKLAPRFEIIWQKYQNNFSEIEKRINLLHLATSNKIICDLKTLFSDLKTPKRFEIILLLATGDSGGGGANNGPGVITLECGPDSIEKINGKMTNIWHELTHLILSDFIKETEEILKKDPNLSKIISKVRKEMNYEYARELIVFSIFTNMSYLSGKYFPQPIRTGLERAVEVDDSDYLLNAYHVFPMYLIYLNGEFIREKLEKKEKISPKEMAKILIKNHQFLQSYFEKHGKKIVWFKY